MQPLPENDYERERMLRVLRNQAKMQAMGIPDVVKACSVPPRKPCARKKRKSRDTQERRVLPSRLCRTMADKRRQVEVAAEEAAEAEQCEVQEEDDSEDSQRELSLRDTILSAWSSWDTAALDNVVKILEENGISGADLQRGLLAGNDDLRKALGIDVVSFQKLSYVWKAGPNRCALGKSWGSIANSLLKICGLASGKEANELAVVHQGIRLPGPMSTS